MSTYRKGRLDIELDVTRSFLIYFVSDLRQSSLESDNGVRGKRRSEFYKNDFVSPMYKSHCN